MRGPWVVAAGERVRGVGVMVTSHANEPLRGLQVRVHGDAVSGGCVRLAGVRARPWSARLAPWEASGWAHSLAPRSDGAWGCTLRAATVRPDQGEGERDVRRAMLRAVWVELDAHAAIPGEGSLAVEVAPDGTEDWVSTEVTVRVHAPVRDVLSLYLAWPGPMAHVARRVRRVLRDIARWFGRLPRGPRAMAAQSIDRGRLYPRGACVVLGRTGLAGDARWDRMLADLDRPGWEGLALRTPGPLTKADETVELTVVDASRFGPGPVELVWSVGRLWLEGRTATPWMRWLRRADPLHGFVAWHPWVPSLLGCTPWERTRPDGPARTLDDLTVRGRVDPADALAVHPPPPLPGRND